MSSPARGEVWLVDLGYVAKVRPCLVVSIPALIQDRALATLAPHTTKPRALALRSISKSGFQNREPLIFKTRYHSPRQTVKKIR